MVALYYVFRDAMPAVLPALDPTNRQCWSHWVCCRRSCKVWCCGDPKHKNRGCVCEGCRKLSNRGGADRADAARDTLSHDWEKDWEKVFTRLNIETNGVTAGATAKTSQAYYSIRTPGWWWCCRGKTLYELEKIDIQLDFRNCLMKVPKMNLNIKLGKTIVAKGNARRSKQHSHSEEVLSKVYIFTSEGRISVKLQGEEGQSQVRCEELFNNLVSAGATPHLHHVGSCCARLGMRKRLSSLSASVLPLTQLSDSALGPSLPSLFTPQLAHAQCGLTTW